MEQDWLLEYKTKPHNQLKKVHNGLLKLKLSKISKAKLQHEPLREPIMQRLLNPNRQKLTSGRRLNSKKSPKHKFRVIVIE